MNRKIIISLLALLMSTTLLAEERNRIVTIAVTDFQCPPAEKKSTVSSVLGVLLDAAVGQVTIDKSKYVNDVRAKVISGISKSYRLRAIDGQFKPNEVMDDGSTLYADGTVTNISVTHSEQVVNKEKRTTRMVYKAQISVTVRLKDAATDAVVNSTTFNVTDYDCSWVETSEGAIVNALSQLGAKIRGYYDLHFPLSANIIEGASEKKDKQKEVYIDLGSQFPVYKGLHLQVYSVKTVAGKKARKALGKGKIAEVMGEDISLCKVTKGGSEIKQAIDAGETIEVLTLE